MSDLVDMMCHHPSVCPLLIVERMKEPGSEFSDYSTITFISVGAINLIQFVLAGCAVHMAEVEKERDRKKNAKEKT